MFCPECGKKNKDGAVFCENCGSYLGNIEETPKSSGTFKFSKTNKIVLTEILLLAVSMLAFVTVYQKKFSASSVVERYVMGMDKGDWNQVYDTLYIKDKDEFLSKQAFVTAETINGVKWGENLEIKKIRKKSGKVYQVTYDGDYGIQKTDVEVKRKGLLWKVDQTDGLIYRDFSIAVPKNADVKIDGIKITADMKTKKETNGMDVYSVDRIFGFNHYIELSGSGIEKTERLISATGETVTVTAGYNEDTVKQMVDQAMDDLNTIFSAASANKKFSEVDILKNMYGDNKETVIDEYESARDYRFDHDSSNEEFVSYSLSNCDAEAQTIEDGNKQMIKVVIKGDEKWKENYTRWDNTKSNHEDENDAEHVIYYIQDGGTWKIYNMELWD